MNELPNPTAVVRAKRCQTCAFIDREQHPTGQVEFFCHRFPPTASALTGQTARGPVVAGTFAHFPAVQQTHWCGEWKARGSEAIVETMASARLQP